MSFSAESPLQIAVLNLFVQLQSRFQNMVAGVITRDSVRNALIKGITADQVNQHNSIPDSRIDTLH